MLIGSIKEIVRHPIKSFYGDSVKKTNVMEYGLYGDRSHAFLDETKPGKYLTITQFPNMARYKAKFSGEESMNEYPEIEITTPEGKVVKWGNEELTKQLEAESKRKISLVNYSPADVPKGAIEEEHIQLVTDASLNQLQKIWGHNLNHRRFRPNLLISLIDQIPFVEEQWFGKTLKIGKQVELRLNRHCERCMIITVDPDHAKGDPSLQKVVLNERNNHFGVYASVVQTGEIHVGDEVLLLD